MGLRIYVAGPISKGDVVRNVRQAIEVAERLRIRGHFPFVPHLTTFHWYFLYMDNHTLDDTSWKEYNMTWLRQSEVFLRIPGLSSGSDNEQAEAIKLNMPIFQGLKEFMTSLLWDASSVPQHSEYRPQKENVNDLVNGLTGTTENLGYAQLPESNSRDAANGHNGGVGRAGSRTT